MDKSLSEYFKANGKKGGLARAKNLSKQERSRIGKMGAAARTKNQASKRDRKD